MAGTPDSPGASAPQPARQGPQGDAAARRAERLKAALKANIARRKDQARARGASGASGGDGAGDSPDHGDA